MLTQVKALNEIANSFG
jgi:hypothetical protein